ncbi:MAG: aquaporin [Verrucomicrobiota bacterium]
MHRLPLLTHWPEYAMEGALLGLFMVSASFCTALLEHPDSLVRLAIPNRHFRRALVGLGMGLTAVALIYSPWGQQSGAHFNPATTLTFLWLGKIKPWDAGFYIGAQFLGGTLGILIARMLLAEKLTHPAVSYVVTVPGSGGATIAFVAEVALSCGMMSMVLWTSNAPALSPYTGLFAGLLVFLYITLEAPLSGMSINPARTFASALPSGIWTAGWLYFAAPTVGMLLAAQIYTASAGVGRVGCPKLDHHTQRRCIFCERP